MAILCIAAILLYGSLAAAQDDHIRNFQVANDSNTYITFSWDIVDGYYNSSDIYYFHLFYQHGSFINARYIRYSWATSNGTTFSYTTSLTNFNNGPYIMWVQVYRRSPLYPSYTYSERKYVKIGIGLVETYYTALELKVNLHPTQTCPEFLLGPRSHSNEASREAQKIIQENCQCNLPYDFSVQDGYFTCTASDYVIFRAKLLTHDSSNLIYLTSLKSDFLTNPDEKIQITINGGKYYIEPGPCGLTVPQLNSPHCLDSAPTQTAVATPQDNTVTTVVAIMSAAMVLVVLGGCIFSLVIELRKINHRQFNTAEVKAARELEMTSEGCSRTIHRPHGNEHVYASPEIPIQDNPSYGCGMAK